MLLTGSQLISKVGMSEGKSWGLHVPYQYMLKLVHVFRAEPKEHIFLLPDRAGHSMLLREIAPPRLVSNGM